MVTFWQALIKGLSFEQGKDNENHKRKSSKNNS